MIYESQSKRKKVFNKLSKVMDDDEDDEDEEKQEDMDSLGLGGEFDDLDTMPGTSRNGHRDNAQDDPYIEGLEDRLCAILETYSQRNVKPHDNSRGAGALGQGPNAPGPVSKTPVLGHSNNKDQKGGTEQSRRRGQLDAKHSAGDGPEPEDEEAEDDEMAELKKDLGMGGSDEAK